MKSRRDRLKELDAKDGKKRFVIRRVKINGVFYHAIIDKKTDRLCTFNLKDRGKRLAKRWNKDPETSAGWFHFFKYTVIY